jgi:hypothetical protein
VAGGLPATAVTFLVVMNGTKQSGAAMVQFQEWRFHNDMTVQVLRSDEGVYYLLLADLCRLIGVDFLEQRRRWRQHPLLRQGLLRHKANGTFADLIRYDMALLWLSSLDTSDVAPASAEELWEFQREIDGRLDAAMYKHFFEEHPWFFSWLDDEEPVVAAYRALLGQLNLAREQMLFQLFEASETPHDDG